MQPRSNCITCGIQIVTEVRVKEIVLKVVFAIVAFVQAVIVAGMCIFVRVGSSGSRSRSFGCSSICGSTVDETLFSSSSCTFSIKSTCIKRIIRSGSNHSW